jgi:hypothetical protein
VALVAVWNEVMVTVTGRSVGVSRLVVVTVSVVVTGLGMLVLQQPVSVVVTVRMVAKDANRPAEITTAATTMAIARWV